MSQSHHQPTLRDLLRPILVHRWLLLGAIVAAVAASVAHSVTQTATYTAQSSLSFQDASRDLALVNLPIVPNQTPTQLATASAAALTQPGVLADVERKLHLSYTQDQLAKKISTSVDANSNLVIIQARQHTAASAAALANTFALVGAAVANRNARSIYGKLVTHLSRNKPPAKQPNALAIYNEQLARLQALTSIASPAQVAETARPPSSPSSPRPVRDAILGGVLGLLIGLLTVYVRDSFDRRLRYVGEIESELGMTLLGHVRDDALGHTPLPGDEHGVSAADWELFRILRRNLDFLDSDSNIPPRTVAVTSSLPQEGKTTVSAFLAFTSAASGRRTLLIECDLRRPVLAARLGINKGPGVTDYVTGHATPAEILQIVRFDDPASVNGATSQRANSTGEQRFQHQLVCITAGTPTQHPVEILGSERFIAMLREVQPAYDVVILDTTPLLAVVDALELLPHVAAVVMCVRATKITRDQARSGKAALDRLPDRPLGLVVTGTESQEEYAYYGYY